MNKTTAPLVRLGLGLAVVSLLAACTSVPVQQSGAPQNADDEQYVYRTSIGSRIPVKVRKSEAQTSRETTERDQRWLSEAQASGVTPPSDPTAGR